MKAYKGFNKDLQCTPNGKVFQYAIGETYEKPVAELCKHGFHACEAPLDVFGYYSPATSRYCEVELDGVSDERTSEDSKVTAKKITVGAEIGIPGLVKAHAEWVKENLDKESVPATNTGYRSAATNTGDCSAATNTGDCSAATNTGYCSAATNTGNYSAATNTGNYSAATNTGYCSAATVGEGGSVAIVTGIGSKAKAGKGSAIVICERGEWNGSTYPIVAIKSAIVDGKTIKADTWYTLKNGDFVEVEE